MKSVVVEGSTVAKAIESAWQKAEKPEEFFVRILQEHSSGFLGFGAQKAKVVLFFKNAQKSDSLFPVVLKQKEYANFFSNDKLKNPTVANVVDTELNKNVSLGGGQKKKQHPAAQQKNNQPARNLEQDKKPHVQNQQVTAAKHPQQQKAQNQPQHKHQQKTQVALHVSAKPVVHQEQKNNQQIEKAPRKEHVVVEQAAQKPKLQHAPKIQSQVVKVEQKVVAPKAPQSPVTPKQEHPKQPVVVKEQVKKEKSPVAPKTNIIAQIEEIVKSSSQAIESLQLVQPVESVQKPQAQAPRVMVKMKRRPLPGIDHGVSGITNSEKSEKTEDK